MELLLKKYKIPAFIKTIHPVLITAYKENWQIIRKTDEAS